MASLDAALVGLLDAAPRPGEVWRHRKGGVYEVVCCAVVESSLDVAVVYAGADGVRWVRPLSEFMDGRFTREGGE